MYYGPEFAGKVLDAWAYEAGVTLSFSAWQAGGECLYRELQRAVPR
jgi:hypothetical protein